MPRITTRRDARIRRHYRVRSKVEGTQERPRLAVFRSLTNIYAQVIDDAKGHTVAAASSLDPDLKAKLGKMKKSEAAKLVGQASEVPEAIRKGGQVARKHIFKVDLAGATLPHQVISKFGAAKVLLKPASPGTGVIAGGGVRAVVEAAGIRDILTKSLGSANHANVVKATIEALRNLRRRDEILKVRGIRPRTNIPGDGGEPS